MPIPQGIIDLAKQRLKPHKDKRLDKKHREMMFRNNLLRHKLWKKKRGTVS